MPRPHLIVLVGIPGSGKTTYATRLQARCPSLRLVSPDIIRERLYPGYGDGRVDVRHIDDHRIFRLAYGEVAAALARGQSVIFDATSISVTRRRKLLTLAHRHGAEAHARYFAIPLETAFRRNRLRPRQVPAGAIAHLARLLVPPQREEGFQRVVVQRE